MKASIVTLAMLGLCAGLAQTQAQAQTPYKDPAGAFTVLIPAGWQTQQQPGSPMVSFVNEKSQASVSMGVIPGSEANTPTADQELEKIQSQFPQACPQAKIKQRGPTTLGGMSGAFLLVNCTNSPGGLEVMKFAVASKPGMLVVLNSASPAANYDAVLPAFNSIEHSLKFLTGTAAQAPAAPAPSGNSRQLAALQKACATGALSKDECDQRRARLTAQAQPAEPARPPAPSQPPEPARPPAQSSRPANSGSGRYRDPQGRYSLAVPAGWAVTPPADAGAGNVQLSFGPSWAMLLLNSGSLPRDVNHQVTQQIQAQYTGFQLLNEGDLQVNGHPAHGSTATGVNPKGARVSVLVISINAGSGHFLTVVSSAPNDQAKSINDTVMQMAQSIRFAGE
ncbi:MAG: hypothetical protein ABSF62_02055 [Bryobacteraceae bacterium]